MNTKKRVELICDILAEKKAKNIISIGVEHLTIIADYFVVCSANSTLQAKAISENLEDKLEEQDIIPKHKEGFREGRWIVLDYNEIIVHIFLGDTRELYSLEKLWSDGTNVTRYDEI